ncbi:MAG TPA: hypothetical protein PKA51_07845 [Kiritimatiellia bacterium]|nr:hypothetical protein [Kiritimatiellia bacterium]
MNKKIIAPPPANQPASVMGRISPSMVDWPATPRRLNAMPADDQFQRMLRFAAWAAITYAPPALAVEKLPRAYGWFVRLGKELEAHTGSAAHALFGIRNMALSSHWHEYAIVGKNFFLAAAKASVVLLLMLGHSSKLPMKLAHRYGAPAIMIPAVGNALSGGDSFSPGGINQGSRP